MVGGNPRHDAYGFRHWTGGNAMHEYYATGVTGRFLGFWSVMVYAAFSVAGPDLIALASGEIRDPRRNIPRVARMVFFRIVAFYVIGVLGVGIICSSSGDCLACCIRMTLTVEKRRHWKRNRAIPVRKTSFHVYIISLVE